MAGNFVTSTLSLLMANSEPFVFLAALSFSLNSSSVCVSIYLTSSMLVGQLETCTVLEEEVRQYVFGHNVHMPTLL